MATASQIKFVHLIDWITLHHTNLISLVAETDELAILVNFIYCDAPTG